jgi:nucleoside-diphosphate-sugar epimerase
MKTILITGSQGFIGSYLCEELLTNNYKVIGIDNYSKYGVVTRPHDTHENFKFYRLDAIDLMKHEFLFDDVDCIVAGAAMIGGISYFHKYAYDLLATNERILASTFDLAIHLHQKHYLKRIITLSSSMVFESTNEYPTPEDSISRNPPPLSTYGFQKLAVEYFCKGAFEQYKLPYTIIRPFNCVGIGEDEALGEEKVMVGNMKMLMSHVLPDLIYKALILNSDDELPILGEGNQVRQYTNGRDIARGIRLAIESENAVNEDFNISNKRPTSVAELANIVWQKIHGTPLKLKVCEPFEYDVQYRVASTQKAKDILNFEANVSLESSVDEVIAWMKKQYVK